MNNNDILTDFESVTRYFGYQTYSINNGKGGMNQGFCISGKTTRKNINIFLLFAFAFAIFYFCMCRSITQAVITLIIFILTFIVFFIHHSILFKKLEKKAQPLNIYQRQLPSNLKPAHVRMLLNDGLIDQISVGATLLDLIDNGYLEIVDFSKKTSIFSSEVNMTIKRTNKDTSNLLMYEKFLIDWFFGICGNNTEISSNILSGTLSSRNDSNLFFTKFKSLVLLSFPINKFYNNMQKTKTVKQIIYTIILLAGFFTFIISPYLIFLPVYGIGGILLLSPSYALNEVGSKQINSWKSLKNFFHDFANKENKSVEMITIWNYYLTYLVVLEENDILTKEIVSFFGSDIDKGIATFNINQPTPNNISEALQQYKEVQNRNNEVIGQAIIDEQDKYQLKINL